MDAMIEASGGGSVLQRQEGGDHYRTMAIQPVEYIVRNRLGFLEGLAIKYISRHARKGKAEDIRKAIHALQLLLELVYPDEAKPL